jgi:hypothetical protein
VSADGARSGIGGVKRDIQIIVKRISAIALDENADAIAAAAGVADVLKVRGQCVIGRHRERIGATAVVVHRQRKERDSAAGVIVSNGPAGAASIGDVNSVSRSTDGTSAAIPIGPGPATALVADE